MLDIRSNAEELDSHDVFNIKYSVWYFIFCQRITKMQLHTGLLWLVRYIFSNPIILGPGCPIQSLNHCFSTDSECMLTRF